MEQERTQREKSGQKREEEIKGATRQDAEQVARLTGEISATGAALDDILADYVSPEGPTETIGGVAAAKRPELRKKRPELDVKAFEQHPGQ